MKHSKIIQPNRVSVFIDYTNVYYRLKEENIVNNNWIRDFDPFKLCQKLVGSRKLVYVHFYCTRPPGHYLNGTKEEKEKYDRQIAYYSKIEENKRIKVKYGSLKGNKDLMCEKDLDTQLTADMVAGAALNEYDTAILISNDSDYVSAVEKVKEFGKRVENVYFKRRSCMDVKKITDVSRRARMSYFEKL